MKTRKYECNPNEYIRMADNPELYDKEQKIFDLIKEVMIERQEERGEAMWEKALPQTLFTILDHYDKYAARIAAKAYLSKEIETAEAPELL